MRKGDSQLADGENQHGVAFAAFRGVCRQLLVGKLLRSRPRPSVRRLGDELFEIIHHSAHMSTLHKLCEAA